MAAVPGVLSPWGYDLIKAFEEFRDDFYCDRAPNSTIGHTHCGPGEGTLTVGYGHACQPESNCQSIIDETRPISEARATEIMKGDVAVMERAAQAITGPLTQDQFDAIISYIFNVGPGPSNMRPLATAINGGDYAAAEDAIRNGIGDKKRRSVEANVFASFSF